MLSVIIDYETSSRAVLKTTPKNPSVGAYNYSRDPTTEITCMGYKVAGGSKGVWVPGHPLPEDLLEAMERGVVYAHNASFERHITNNVGRRYGRYRLPYLHASRLRCIAAKARHANLPGKLEDACNLLGTRPKDAEGHEVMKSICKVKADGSRCRDPEKLARVYEYCLNDIDTEMELASSLPALPDYEQRVWELDRKVNERGVPIDLDMCKGAVRILRDAYSSASQTLASVTGGVINSGGQIQRMLKYANERGVNIENMQEPTLDKIMEEDIPDDVRQVFELRQLTSSAAVKKYRSALTSICDDGRSRETTIYYGASQSGRWAGTLWQPLNMKKGMKLDDNAIAAISSGSLDLVETMYSGPMTVKGKRVVMSPVKLLGNMVRGLVCAPPGKMLADADSSQIELRLAHWLAGDRKMMEALKGGADPYKVLAAKMLRVPVGSITKDQRDKAKPLALGVQYMQGAKRFSSVSGMPLSKSKEMVDRYRADNPEITYYWDQLHRATVSTVRNGGPVQCGRLTFAREGKWMTMRLPSGRKLYYFEPRIVMGKFDKPAVAYRRGHHLEHTHAGHFLENACQAICRDLLCSWMLELDRQNVKILLNVYDQILSEAACDEAKDVLDLTLHVMRTNPDWCRDLPLDADGSLKKRWEK